MRLCPSGKVAAAEGISVVKATGRSSTPRSSVAPATVGSEGFGGQSTADH